MDKKSFFIHFFDIEANSSLPHAEDPYKAFDFDIMISNPIGKEPYIVVFTPVKDKESLSLIVELPQNECHIDFGHTDIFFIDKKPVRKGKKRIKLLKLINNFLKSNGLIEV